MRKAFIVVACLVSPSVVWAAPTLTVNGSAGPITVSADSMITVVAANLAANDSNIVALFVPGTANSQSLNWVYLTGTQTSRSGQLTEVTTDFALPATGTFEVRALHWVSGTGYVTDATSPSVTAQNSGAAPTLNVNSSAGPITVAGGSTITVVAANLAANDSNVVALFAPGTGNSQSLNWVYLTGNQTTRSGQLTGVTTTFTLPSAPGTFEVRALHWVVGTGYVTDATSALVTASTSPGLPPAPKLISCGVNPVSAQSGNWSDPATWAGCIPSATDHATVEAGHTVIVEGTVTLTEVTVNGRLAASRIHDSLLDVGSVIVLADGTLDYGTIDSPIPAGINATIRLRDIAGATYTHLHGQADLQPVLHAHGGAIEMQGTGPAVPWMPLAADAPAGSLTLTVADDLTGWRAGDAVLITGTVKLPDDPACLVPVCQGDPTKAQSEERVVAFADASTHRLTITAPLTYAHGGVLPSADCRACRQAVVANLTRNVVVMSADPMGRRGHVHLATDVLDSATGHPPTVHIHDAAFVSLGRLEPGVYGGPHLHLLGPAADASVTRNVIRNAINVWVRVHGTHQATIADNIGYRTVGNGYSTEDASEAFNVFDHNLAVQATPSPVRTNPADPADGNEGSGFWANTPRNTWTRNVAVENAWGFQIGDKSEPIAPPHFVTSIDLGGGPVTLDIRSAALLRFDGNTATGNTSGGIEIIGVRGPDSSVIDHFTALDHNFASFATRSLNVVFDHLYAAHGGQGELAQRMFHLRDNAFYVGQQNATIRNSYVSAIHTDYQMVGWVLLDHVQLDYFLRSMEGPGENVISILGPTSATGGIPYDVSLLNSVPLASGTTAQMEVILWDYDGPGQHVVLHQAGTNAADNLTYTPNSRFGDPSGAWSTSWQEARFTGPTGQGPEFAWPLRIDVGNRPGVTPDLARTDRIEGGVRWRVDALYVPSPPGTRLARYGFSSILPPQLMPTDNFTTAHLSDPSVLGSHRTGEQFRYTVDLPNGNYWVDLGWQESYDDIPDWMGTYRGPGTRVMNIDAQGVTRIAGLDVFAEAGLYVPRWKSFAVSVTNERLWLDFKRASGYFPMVSAIAVCPMTMVRLGRCP